MSTDDTVAYWKAVLERQGIHPGDEAVSRLTAMVRAAPPPPLTPKLTTEMQLVQRVERWEAH